MKEPVSRIPALKAFHALGWPRTLPLNLTVSTLGYCNSKCLTCNIWKNKGTQDLSLEEWDKTFQSIGDNLFWVTMSGGEPFMRKDLPEMCQSVCRHCRPGIINIPTNGILSKAILEKTRKILESCPDPKIIINLSLDGLREQHDRIRGVPGNWEKSMETLAGLKELKKEFKNLEIGINTVISKHNVTEFPRICDGLLALEPDSYITEIAEERPELGTVGFGLTPSAEEYAAAIDHLLDRLAHRSFKATSKVTQAFRKRYYAMVKEVLRKRTQAIPCMAGVASAQINWKGDVWTCCVRAQSMGNLRDHGYDFPRIWFNAVADKLRKSIKDKECFCPLANAAYTTMLCDLKTLASVAAEVVIG